MLLLLRLLLLLLRLLLLLLLLMLLPAACSLQVVAFSVQSHGSSRACYVASSFHIAV